jgi:WD40 repeat protein
MKKPLFLIIVLMLAACNPATLTTVTPIISTYTPTPFQPLARGTALPEAIEPIAPATAASLTQLAFWETGLYIGHNLVFRENDKVLLIGLAGKNAEEWSMVDGNLIRRLDGEYFPGFEDYSYRPDQALSPDGRFKVYVDPSSITISYPKNSSELVAYTDPASPTSVKFMPDGNYMAIGCANGDIWFIPTESWEQDLLNLEDSHMYGGYFLQHPLSRKVENTPYGIYFSPDGFIMMISFKDGPIQIWDVSSLTKVGEINAAKDFIPPSNFAFTYDGKIVAITSKGNETQFSGDQIQLWDITTGHLLVTLKQGSGNVQSITFSANNQYLASTTSTKGVSIWGILRSGNQTPAPAANLTPSATRKAVSLPLPTSTATSSIASYESIFPLAWPVTPPTDGQIQEARDCAMDELSDSRYPEGIKFGQLGTTFTPKTACDWAALAVAYAKHANSENIPEEGKRALAQAVMLNPAIALKSPLFYMYFGALNTVQSPPFAAQLITKLILDYKWSGMGEPGNIQYHIEIRQANSPSDGMKISLKTSPADFASEASTSIDPALIQALGPALVDFLPIRSAYTDEICSDNSPDWQARITFQDGTTLDLDTHRSNVTTLGGPWQARIAGQDYVQFSGALVEAFYNILNGLNLPFGEPWASACMWGDPFKLAYP